MYIQNSYDVISGLNNIKTKMESYINKSDDSKVFWAKPFKDLIDSLNKHYKVPQYFIDELEDISEIKSELQEHYYIEAKEIKPRCSKLYDEVTKAIEKAEKESYYNLIIDGQYYKVKTLLYSEENNDKIIRLLIGSFYSYREHDMFLTNLQKGYRSLKMEQWRTIDGNLVTIKNGYVSRVKKSKNANTTDGVHAVIFGTDENLLMAKKDENPVDLVYKWLDTKFHVPLLNIPILQNGAVDENALNRVVSKTCTDREGYINEVERWKEYFYNSLNDDGLIKKCKGFDLTGNAPQIIMLSSSINDDLLWEIAKRGIKEGFIKIPVDKEISLSSDMSFTDFIMDRILPYINGNEELYYKIGDPINPIFDTPVVFEGSGEKSEMFPRQKVIAQGFLNYLKEIYHDKNIDNSIFLNGGMGVGKTITSIKLAFALMKEVFGRDTGRCVLYCQGHLIGKWKRQFRECLNPIGINPIFYEIETFKDVYNIPVKPEGFEVILMPKDRVKRSYQQGYNNLKRFNNKYMVDVFKCIKALNSEIEEEIKDTDGMIIIKTVDIPVNALRLTARKLSKEFRNPVILLKERLDSKGKVKEYLVSTTSDILKGEQPTNKPYDLIIKANEIGEFYKMVDKIEESLLNEYKTNSYKNRNSYIQNGFCCNHCGGFQFKNPYHQIDKEKKYENITIKPSNRSTNNLKCNSFIKADGTPLFEFEKKALINGELNFEILDRKVNNPYVDDNGESIIGEDLVLVKSNRYEKKYKVLLKVCNHPMWGAVDAKGYRTVNAVDVMLKRFGKKSVDINISDEFQIFSNQSEQGNTFSKICQLSKINIGLSGTISGGKASDLYYIFWRMIPKAMVQSGYKYSDVNRFVDHFGRKKKISKEGLDSSFNKTGKGKKSSTGWNEIAGISPLLYNNFLSGRMISRTLNDMNIPMPELKYFKHEVELSDELKESYDALKQQFIDFIRENKGSSVGGSYLHTLLSYTDLPNQEPVYHKYSDQVIAVPKKLDMNTLFPKEIKLLQTIEKELKEGRRVLVYSVYSGKKGVSDRLVDIISKKGYKVAELTSSVELSKREQWIQDQYEKGVEVLVTNPVCVETGLDIIQYPTIYFYSTSYNIKVIRQAEMRSWRVSQKKECRIYYSYYLDTIQHDAVKLVGSKKKSSLQLEGIFSEDMLSQLSEVEDNGSQMLFNALKGKIKLKEDELDAFNFQSEVDVSKETAIATTIENVEIVDASIKEIIQEIDNDSIEFFTVTDNELKKAKLKSKKVEVGQMSFLAMSM